MDPVQKAGDNHVERVAALEEYLTLTSAHEGETWFRCRGLDRGPRARGTSPRPGHCRSRLARLPRQRLGLCPGWHRVR
jgi:hypothetical protein